MNATNDTYNADWYERETQGSQAGTGLALIGVVLNLVVLTSVYRHRISLLYTAANNLTWIMTLMMATSVLNGIFVAAVNESLVQDTIGEVPGDVVCSIGYLLLFILFSCNLLLSLERHWLVKHQTRLPWYWVVGTGCIFIPLWVCVVVSFYLSDDTNWDISPLGFPTSDTDDGYYFDYRHSYGVLFLIGLSFFPIVSLAICAIYENTYFLIADLYDEPDSKWFENDRMLNKRTRLHRNVLIRCIVMSSFQLVLYAPSLVFIYIDIFKPQVYESQTLFSWVEALAASIPGLDPLLTAAVILLFTDDFKAAFVGDLKVLWDCATMKRKGRIVSESTLESEIPAVVVV